jgi:hypothetical protein
MIIGFALIITNVIVTFFIYLFDMFSPIQTFDWIAIIGFGLFGLVFIKLLRRYEPQRLFLRRSINRTFRESIFIIIVLSFGIVMVDVILNLLFRFNGMNSDTRSTLRITYIITSNILRLIIYISILIMGLTFYYIIFDIFRDKRFENHNRFFSSRIITIGLLIGIVGVIAQVIFVLILFLALGDIIPSSFDSTIDIRFGEVRWIHTVWIPFALARLLIMISLLLMFFTSINSIPGKILKDPVKLILRINLKVIFYFGTVIVLFFSFTQFLIPILGVNTGGLGEDESIIVSLYRHFWIHVYIFLRELSSSLVLLGFALISLVFYKILRKIEWHPYLFPSKPT